MKRILIALVAGLALAALQASDSAAQQGRLVTATTVDLIIAGFERNGFQVELTRDGVNPQLKSTVRSEPFTVNFYGCDENGENCTFIQFTTGWNLEFGITLAKIEEWNSTKVFGQAYRDANKNPWLSMPVNMKGGVSIENFDDTVDWWKFILREFEKHIGWE